MGMNENSVGRPIVKELSWFKVSTNFFDQSETQVLEENFGADGSLIMLKLWANIYGNKGYYHKWDKDAKSLFKRRYAPRCNNLDAIINKAVELTLEDPWIDKRLLDKYHIITSKAIQRRYFLSKRKTNGLQVISEYLLIDKEELPKHFVYRSILKQQSSEQGDTSIKLGINAINAETTPNKSELNSEQTPIVPSELYIEKSRIEKNRIEKNREEENVSNSPNSQPALFEFLLKGGGIYPITQEYYESLKVRYPGLDIREELKEMNQWIIDNPRKRKQEGGIPRFVTNWLKTSSTSAKNIKKGSSRQDVRKDSGYNPLWNKNG